MTQTGKTSPNSEPPSPHNGGSKNLNSVYQPGKKHSILLIKSLSYLFFLLSDRVAAALKAFLDDFDYSPTGINPVNQELEDFMREVMIKREMECPLLNKTLRLMASIVQVKVRIYHSIQQAYPLKALSPNSLDGC